MSYFERYLAGEHDEVWDELRALGPTLLDGPHVDDARRVAAATMDRVRLNLERVASGLAGLGYEFVAIGPSVPDAGSVNAAVMASGAEALRSLPGVDPRMVEQMLASMPQLLGGLAGSSFAHSAVQPESIARSTPFAEPQQHAAEARAYEAIAGPLPLSIAAFWDRIGGIELLCRNPDGEVQHALRPLAVFPALGLLNDHGAWEDDGGGAEFWFDLVPDPADDSDTAPIGAAMVPGADARLANGEWFIDHLRRMIRNAGFGVADLPDDIRRLAGQLEPF